MSYDPTRHHRRSIRLRGYDYSQTGAYFVTFCVQNRLCLFGEVVDGEMRLNAADEVVDRLWRSHFIACSALDFSWMDTLGDEEMRERLPALGLERVHSGKCEQRGRVTRQRRQSGS